MGGSVWSLPGPAQFVDTIRNELTSGRNVVAMVPRYAPGDLRSALRSIVPDAWAWVDLRVESTLSPAAVLCQMYGVKAGDSFSSTIRNLAVHEGFAGQLVWVGSRSVSSWEGWKAFLLEYADACRGIPEGKRSLFVVLVDGLPSKLAPCDDVTLCTKLWSDVVGEIDLLIYASLRLQRSSLHASKRKLLAVSVSRIALWDFDVADRLLDERPQDMLAPAAILDELARDRGWNGETPVTWEAGTENYCDGARHIHSSMCLLQGDERTVTHRVWSAQASVILPLIEKRRLELLKDCRRFLRLPVEVDGEVISNPEDLEIGHLAHTVSRSAADPILKQRLQRLRRVRNHLAHMETLDLGLAWHDDIYADPP
jgi:hypothetical protein